ncbi:competence protein CoiA [Streptomyces sp. LHD-70]|uniref:competence protein CoiA family protein n=1 Tax=Streptomyces sp. LHD-70 TaxID=3072140 RepID=UPI00280FA5B1|nr:competence protein CoiA [Streptomyces sp. LHD-70]MDQ8707568.1 competence protein CoiA [Streptomyces sp. LHD-70]
MYAKTSHSGLRFFAHAPGAPTCALGLESVAHHLLKLELATAAREAGAHAELEVPGPDRTWRADVLATDPTGNWRTALEAQLAPITSADITARTEKMHTDGVTSIWFSDRPRPPWLGTVPSVRLERPEGTKNLTVAEGLVKFSARGWRPVPAGLPQFLTWAFAGRIVTHTPRTPLWYPQRSLATVWTAPQYIAAEDTHLLEEERRQHEYETRRAALRAAQEKKRDEIRAKNAISRAKALEEATAAEQAARTAQTGRLREVAIRFRPGIDPTLAKLADEHGVTATVGWSTGDPRYAGGVPLVDENGVPVAVFDPDPGRVRGHAFRLLAGLLLIFPSQPSQRRFEKATKRAKRRPIDGYQTGFVGAPPSGPARPRPHISSSVLICTCTTPQLVARIQNAEYPAEPSDQMGPAAALFRPQCRACGGKYEKPWRRIGSAPINRTSSPEN